MAHWFEDVTKTLADEKIGRRTALHRVIGALAGAALASAIPEIAEARRNYCTGGGTCSSDFVNCLNDRNVYCYCFTQLDGSPVCGCDGYCSQLQVCDHSTKCPKTYACIISTGCNRSTSQGVCVPKCKGKNKHCTLGSGHGTTAAGRVV